MNTCKNGELMFKRVETLCGAEEGKKKKKMCQHYLIE